MKDIIWMLFSAGAGRGRKVALEETGHRERRLLMSLSSSAL